MKISLKNARALKQACFVATSGTHAVTAKLANGDTSVANRSFELEDRGRIYLNRNLALADHIVEQGDKSVDGIRRELSGGLTKQISVAEQPAAFEDYATRAENLELGGVIVDGKRDDSLMFKAPFLKVKRSWLKESINNPMPGHVLLGLRQAGVLDDDLPAAATEDVIAD